MDFFAVHEPLRAIQGDTLPEIRIDVTGVENIEGCTMRVVMEHRYNPGTIVFSKTCTKGDGDYYTVQLLTEDTEDLEGAYNLYYILTDGDGNDHKNLVGTIEMLKFPQEAT